MAKRKSRKQSKGSNNTGWILVLALIAVGIIAGCSLIRPTQRPHGPAPQSTIAETATPESTAEATATQSPTESPTESASPLPTAPRAENSGGPKLALIIDDCGQWVDIERGFIALPIPLTMSVLPHVHAGTEIADEAQAAGKGVMLHLPMETLSGMYPGPGEVTTKMSDDEIAAQVADDLAQVPLAKGVNNHEGSKGSADERVMKDVIAALQKHGDLFFIDSRTNSASVGAQVAAAAGVPTASRDVFLDNKEDVAYSEAQLLQAVEIAKRTGSAIAIGHPRKTTLEAVTALIPKLQADGIEFVLAQSLTR